MANFITKKVLEFIKSDEKSNVEAVLETAYKRWNKNVLIALRNIDTLKRQRDEKLEELNEYLSEAKESYKESFLSIEPSKRNKDERELYIAKEYEVQIAAALTSVRHYEEEILNTTGEFNKQIEVEQKKHDLYMSYCKAITTTKETSSNNNPE